MTCIGNSGPFDPAIVKKIQDNDLVAAAIASSNRNFEGRINANVKANYLASPPLVVAFSIAGRVDIDMLNEPLGKCKGKDVFLADIWPSNDEIASVMKEYVTSETFKSQYKDIFEGSDRW